MATESTVTDRPLTQLEQYQLQLDLEEARNNGQLVLEAKRAKLEAIKLAKETLVENSRSKPVDSRDISASDIVSFANTLMNYVNS